MAFLSPVRPLMIQYAVDHFILVPQPGKLALISALMILVLFAEALGLFFSSYVSNLMGQHVVQDMRNQVYAHITRMKTAYFDRNPIGALVTRVVSDIETIASVFTEGVVIVFGDLLQLAVILIVMFTIDWRLALISISTIPLLLIATNIFKNGIKSAFQDVRTQISNMNTFVQEHISGMNVVQIFNRQEEEQKRFTKINKAHTQAHIRSVWHYSVFLPVVEILSAISLGLLIWLGARGVMNGTFSTGNLVAFTMYIGMLFRPIRTLADRFNTLQMGMVSSERVFKVLDTEEIIEDKGEYSATTLEGRIQFKEVSMSYVPGTPVLNKLSFEVPPGSTVAIVGATGSGKSSIINLINRSYEFQEGEILVDGKDIRSYRLSNLRKHIAIVLQDVFLFSDTIANNISLHDPSISREDIEEAARQVGADEFIRRLPGGFDFNVMERGGMLSAGQRQLIAFIRAYLYNPEILVLDEATSSVDTETERLIQQAIEKLTHNRTSIVIAHRLATVQNASQILVMDKGRLLESGTHQQLLKKNGQYKRLFELQFGEEA